MKKYEEKKGKKGGVDYWWNFLWEWRPSAAEQEACRREYERMQQLFERVDQQVRSERLYLIPHMNLEKMARKVGTNRTYLSRAMAIAGVNFRDYLFRLRLQELDKVLCNEGLREELQRQDIDFYAVAGFHDTRTLSRRLLQERGVTYAQLVRGGEAVDNGDKPDNKGEDNS